MAATKKVTAKPVVKATEAAVKTTAPKTEEKKTEVKTAEKKAEVTPVEKKEVKPAEKKPVAKKAPAKKTVKKAELKSAVYVQFAGKSYAQEDLIKIAKDVWKYDLKQKAGDLTSVELYVKPEESMVYYVMNKEFTGSFYI
ncbi:MAG: DUF6465 family protein [Lachnospiraceae bacterium]|nr:DUF6465 family protein [Lachnospiraceae bacterium]